MENEIKEKMNELLDKLFDNLSENIEKTENKFKEALSNPCKIHIDNNGVGTTMKIEGERLSLLLTLAGVEKKILSELKCSDTEFDFIKDFVDTKED